jgi:signal transduction histidine kinase
VAVPIVFLVAVLRMRGTVGPLAPLAARLGGSASSSEGAGGPDVAADPRAIGDAARTALGDPSLALLRAQTDGGWRTESGEVVDLDTIDADAPERRAVTMIGSADAPIAALVHDRALLEQPELLEGVVAVVRIALDNERLETALREQLHEVTESRARIVAATEEERRRLERDLHDGAQQRLVAATLALQEARAVAGTSASPEELRSRLDALSDELAAATRELRELARGIHPAILEHEGLRAAVAGLARRATIPVEVHADLDGRLPDVVESTAYFTVAEALTNAQRYAQATYARVDLVVDDHRLEVGVIDDGVGGADPTRGSGLRGLADRMHALGGELGIDSRPGQGTTIRARIPIP